MPELPDIALYLEALEQQIVGRALTVVTLKSPFLLRTVDPPLAALVGRPVLGLTRLGKRIVFGFEGELYLVLHLMIAGRLKWLEPGAKQPERISLATFHFPEGRLLLAWDTLQGAVSVRAR